MIKENTMEDAVFEPGEPGEAVPVCISPQYRSAGGPPRDSYPVRWLRGHYPISQAVAEIVAAEFGWGAA